MHFINRAFLKLALLPLPLYQKMGVDPGHLKAILSTKLTLDDRRPLPIMQTSQTKNSKPASKATLGTVFMSALTGIFFLFCFLIGNDSITQLTFYFTFFFVFLSMMLVSDFTSVLIDVRDNFILLPKPVADKTVVVARLLHIFIHLCKVVVPMGLPGVVFLAYREGFYGSALLLLLIFLLTAFAIFFINAVYIAILKFTTPQRFQSIITWVQIVFSIAVFGSYQIFPRLFSRFTVDDYTIVDMKGIGFYPLYWFANSWKLLVSFGGSPTVIIAGIAGIVFPLLCIVVVVNYLAPSFNRKLSLIASGDSGVKTPSAIKTIRRNTVAQALGRILTFGSVEKASFLFTWQMMDRSRDFKMKVYPGIGYIVIYAVLIFFRSDNMSLEMLREETPSARMMLLSGLYMTVFLLTTATGQMVFSDKYKASWIYYTSPVMTPGHVVTGSLKAVLAKFLLPVAAVLSAVALWFGGTGVLPNLILGWCNVVLITALLLFADKHYFPFSSSQSTNSKSGNFLKGISMLVLSGVIAVGHYLIYSFLPVVVICAVLSAIATWLLFSSLRQISWEKVLSTYTEG